MYCKPICCIKFVSICLCINDKMYCQSKVDNNKKHCKTNKKKQKHLRSLTFVSQHFPIWPAAAILNLRKKKHEGY